MDKPGIRPEIQKLIDRGNVTADEIMELRCNSWEWEALIPRLNDQAFVARFEHALYNCSRAERRPFATYDEAVKGLLAPELLRRFKVLREIAEQRLNRLIDRDILPEGLRVISSKRSDGETVSTDAPTAKQICGALGPNNQARDREPNHRPPHGVGCQSALPELWLVRLWPNMGIVGAFPTEQEARERGVGGGYRIDGPYLLEKRAVRS